MSEAEWIAFLARPEFPAFNRAMLVNPADDLPRLVFADWMDENCPDVEVNQAVRRSIVPPRESWNWPGRLGQRTTHPRFLRGRISLSGSIRNPVPADRPPRTHMEALWRSEWVDTLRVGCVSRKLLDRWAADPLLDGVTHLDFDNGSPAYGENPLFVLHSPHLSRLKSIRLFLGSNWPSRWFLELWRFPVLAQLESLTLDDADLQAAQFEQNIGSLRLSNLRTLSLMSCPISDGSAVAIANSPHLSGLTRLKMHAEYVTDAGAAALANSPYLCEAIRAQWRR